MVDITKDEFWGAKYKEVPKWRQRKTRGEIIREFVSNHKFLTAGLICLGACMISNAVLIYSFIKVLGTI